MDDKRFASRRMREGKTVHESRKADRISLWEGSDQDGTEGVSDRGRSTLMLEKPNGWGKGKRNTTS